MDKNYKRMIGPMSMLLCSVTTIIGSGWLFSGYFSSKIAGPAAIVSWVLGAFLVLIVAFTFAELSTMLAVPGGSSHFPHITHGTLVSIVLGWISWLSVAVIAPIEVQAVLQYASFIPSFSGLISETGGESGALSHLGYFVATLLMIFFSVMNIYSLRWVLRLNNAIAIWKLVIPVIAALALIIYGFKSSNFTSHGFFAAGWRGVFQAISAGGIVFAYNGFKTVVEMAGEASNPRRTIPVALIGSIIACMLVYILLQVAFLGAVPADALANGWTQLTFSGAKSPLITLLLGIGSVFILALLYIDTMVAPMGAGLIYVTSGARILQAMGHNKQMPMFTEMMNKQGIPVYAILVNFVLGMLFFLPFPGWQKMMEFISSLMAFSYALGPICLLVLRYQLPKQQRGFKIPLVHLWSFLAFFICTLMSYWTGWEVISKLDIFLLLCLGFYIGYRIVSPRAREIQLDFKPSIWIWFYFAGIALISYLGGFGGGKNILPFGVDFMVIAILSAVTLFLAVKFRVDDQIVQKKFAHIAQQYNKPENLPEIEEDPNFIKEITSTI